jgi:HlyD family secretion protein
MRAAPRSSAQADEASARASVEDARAALANDETNLSKASIRSPIDGVVLTRSVEPGNAVAASLQAVTLFTVAEDLGQLQLEVNVDEADVGAVRVGQKASFTVSAYPSRRYPADHPRGLWLHQDRQRGDLHHLDGGGQRRPEPAPRHDGGRHHHRHRAHRRAAGAQHGPALHAGQRGCGGRCLAHGGASWRRSCRARPGGARGSGNGKGPGQGARRQVWVLQDGKPQAMAVQVGISDGRMTEVSSEQLQPGMAVITDQRSGGRHERSRPQHTAPPGRRR